MSDSAYPECFLSEEAGFLPGQPPLESLPPGYASWDELAAQLRGRVAGLEVASAIARLPELSAENLPVAALSRAASLLGIFVHALVREQQLLRVPIAVPDHLRRTWERVCQRLRRPSAGLTYTDLILYNWRLRDPRGPRHVENMDLLVPVYGSREERLFNLVMVETHTVATPLVGAVRQLEQAIQQDDDAAVVGVFQELSRMLDVLTFETFLKLDPNPSSPTFVDHLVWGKTVAPFAFPVRDGELGLSGGGSPVFHVLDALLGRSRWHSTIGQELLALQRWMNPPLVDLVRRAAGLDLSTRVQARPALQGAYYRLREAYAGERGWLGVHRLKVYGFMEVAFKAGRTQTNGGFSGEVADRAWEGLDDELETSRQERPPAGRCPMARQLDIRPVAAAPVFQVRLDAPLDFRPGDRLGIWPRNTPELVDRTLAALLASGDEPLRLSSEWKTALTWLSALPAGATTMPLRSFLAYAKLRPLTRAVGKALLQLVHVPDLHDVLEQRQEDHYEVWEALEAMRRCNYDPRRLWRADPWHKESLARILPPERRRIYSISSAPADAPGRGARATGIAPRRDDTHAGVLDDPAGTLDLTVGRLALETRQLGSETAVARFGTGSHHLTRAGQPFPVEVVRPSRFSLPGVDHPVVMLAAGSGISPFRGFWQSRRDAPAPTWLVATVRDAGSLAYATELAVEVSDHGLEVHVTCSRSDEEIVSEQGRLITRAAQRGYADRAIAEHRQRFWDLLRPERDGGREGHFYICGQTRFAHTVLAALEEVVATQLGEGARSAPVRDFMRRLHAEGRLMMDIFTTFAPGDAPSVHPYRTWDASEVIQHNNERNGYWCIISGQVYDLTEFVWLHPGGARLIRLNAGLDATRSYEKVNHHLNPEVHASLDLYKIGRIRRLDLGRRWGVTILPQAAGPRPESATARADGLLHFTLHDLYRHWMRYVFHVVELENSLAGNRDLGRSPRLVSAPAGSPLHLALQVDMLRVFFEVSLAQVAGSELRRLWHLHAGLCSPATPLHALAGEMEAAEARWRPVLQGVLQRCRQRLGSDRRGLGATLETILEASQLWLGELKTELGNGIRAFETHESRVVEQAGARLTGLLAGIPARLVDLAGRLHSTGLPHPY